MATTHPFPPAQEKVATRRLMRPQSKACVQLAVREFKNRLSELLKLAEAGEVIVVASHGRPVARLGPVAACAPPDPVESLWRLRSQPWLHPSDGQLILAAAQPIPSVPAGESLLTDLLQAATSAGLSMRPL